MNQSLQEHQVWVTESRERLLTGTPVVVVRALHKSGSMFLYKFFRTICQRLQWEYYSANNSADNEQDGMNPSANPRCLCPIRDFSPAHFHQFPDTDNVYQLFHVRDPRDMIVSEYYSFGWTHTDQSFDEQGQQWRNEVQKMSVDEYALNQPEFSSWPIERKFAPLLELQEGPRHRFVKYETMVTDFPRWVNQVVPPFAPRWSSFLKARLLWKYRGEFEVDGKHKRRITPGDHRRQLQPKTIQILNDRYAAILEKFGYST